jgi:hypothetical protein
MINADYVQLPAGEEIVISDGAVNARVYGVYVLDGSYTISAAGDPHHVGRTFTPTENFVPNDITCSATAKAQDDAVWFCFSQNDDVRRTVSQMIVSGNAVLPAGTGFFVVSGTVQADGKTASQFQFFRPRDADISVQGLCTLILVE